MSFVAKIRASGTSSPRIAKGERLYAIGDIHGRLDLFADLVARIRHDSDARAPRITRLILLGDLVDRGEDSAALVRQLRSFPRDELIILKGNHEQVMTDALDGNLELLQQWLFFGGDATLRSWGVADDVITGSLSDLWREGRRRVTPDTLRWMRRLPLSYRSGDFFFVHAGVRPGVPLAAQQPTDLMWITDEFLDSEADHHAVIVHGHSVMEDGPVLLPNRISIDTGAYRTGKLTAVGFEDDRQWTLTT